MRQAGEEGNSELTVVRNVGAADPRVYFWEFLKACGGWLEISNPRLQAAIK